MPRTNLARRGPTLPDIAATIRAEMIAALGYNGAEADVLREAGETLRSVMTDKTVDAADRLRAVGMVIDLVGPRPAVSTGTRDGGRGPLVNLTLVAAPAPAVRADVVDVDAVLPTDDARNVDNATTQR